MSELRIKSPCVQIEKVFHLILGFWWKKEKIYTCHSSKQTIDSQLQHIHFNLRTMTLLAIFKLNGNKSSWIERPGKGIILSVRSQAVFEE